MIAPVEKNKIYTIEIVDLGSEGQGIGKVDNFTVFIPMALIGEVCEVLIVKVNKNFAFGKVINILKKSPMRVSPVCSVANKCGGCSLQHLSYEGQLKFKEKKVESCISRIGKIENLKVSPIIGMENPYNYRNKSQLPVGKNKSSVAIGFYAQRSHNIVEYNKCVIQHEINEKIIPIVKEFITEFNIPVYNEETNKGLIRHILTRVGFKTNEVMVCIIANGAKIPNSEVLIERLRKIEGVKSIMLNINRLRTNVILGDKTRVLWGEEYITDYIDNIKFKISAESFYQVNPVQTEILYKKAVEACSLTGEENVLDLYCGIGTISLFLAQKAKKVVGIEIVEKAVEDARENAEINAINNIEFRVGLAEEVVPQLETEGFKPDVIVVDPPRKGCDAQVLNTIINMKPKKLVYVSCEPSTLARDINILSENGFSVETVQPVDQFCHSTHVETVVLLSSN